MQSCKSMLILGKQKWCDNRHDDNNNSRSNSHHTRRVKRHHNLLQRHCKFNSHPTIYPHIAGKLHHISAHDSRWERTRSRNDVTTGAGANIPARTFKRRFRLLVRDCTLSFSLQRLRNQTSRSESNRSASEPRSRFCLLLSSRRRWKDRVDAKIPGPSS